MVDWFQLKDEDGYISKIVELINNNIIGKTSARSISLLMHMNRNYLSDKQRREGRYEQFSKYFTLATNFLLLNHDNHKIPNCLHFKSKVHYKRFINGTLKIIFQEMVRKGVYSKDEALILQRTQFNALVYTLFAVNKGMKNKRSHFELGIMNPGKAKKFLYTWNSLSKDIGGVETLSQTLKYEMVLTPEKIALIKNILDNFKPFAPKECKLALDLIEGIPRLRFSDRAGYIGILSHPVLENFFREIWLDMNILSRHEIEFNKPRSNHRIDSLLKLRPQPKLKNLLENSLNMDLRNYEAVFIDYTMPSLISLKQTGGVLEKLSPDKNYLAKNRLLVIVFYGYYNNTIFEVLRELLINLNIPFKKNILFMDVIKFARFFNFKSIDIQNLEDINEMIKRAFLGDEESLITLEKLSDNALYQLIKAERNRTCI